MNSEVKTVGKVENVNPQTQADECAIVRPVNLTEKYVFMDETLKALDIALISQKNLILYGKGGHGKSEISLDFLKEKGIEPYIITMGSGTTVDRLFGGVDLKLFNDTGKIEYLVENSFMNHEFVIFEELFDAPDYILEQLKDILSSRTFRNGTQFYPIKTRLIICCTNKTRDQFSKNDSLKALMERFPLEQEVTWKEYNTTTYEKLLTTVRGYADPMLTYILQEYAKGGLPISPRIAITAADLLERFGPESLTYLADFRAKSSLLTDGIKKFKSIFEIRDIKEQLTKLSARYDAEVAPNLSNVDEIHNTGTIVTDIVTNVKKHISKLKSIKTDDSLAPETANIISTYTKVVENWEKEIGLMVKLAKME
jgi:hypothetical protein